MGPKQIVKAIGDSSERRLIQDGTGWNLSQDGPFKCPPDRVERRTQGRDSRRDGNFSLSRNRQLNTNTKMQTALFTPPQNQPSALVQVESSRAVQEVQASLVIAKKFPRDQLAALDRIKTACQRPTLANVAVYQYGRGGTDITGPSIRLAEAIAQQWGNLTFGFTELEQSNGSSTCEAFCWDLETNTKRSVTFQVPHVRYSKSKGNTALSDPRDIYELVANNASRRVRACILATIPGDVVEAALEQCDETMRATADVSPAAQTKIVEAFAGFGVSKAQIEKRIQRRIDAITPAQVVALRKIITSMKDGMSKASEWFEEIVEGANVPKSAPSKPKQEPAPQAPIEADFKLNETPVSLLDQLADRIAASGFGWPAIATEAEQGGLFLDPLIPINEQPEDVLRDVLGAFEAIVSNLKK